MFESPLGYRRVKGREKIEILCSGWLISVLCEREKLNEILLVKISNKKSHRFLMSVFVLLAKEGETGDNNGNATTESKQKIKATAELHGGGWEVVSVVANCDTTTFMKSLLVHILKNSRSKKHSSVKTQMNFVSREVELNL